jgi:hypothetical protein
MRIIILIFTVLSLTLLSLRGIGAEINIITPSIKEEPDIVAKRLAERVIGANRPAERERAILDIMKVLHIPVYSANGEMLTPRPRDLPSHFNLYDFELKIVADAFARNQMMTLDELTKVLSRVDQDLPVSSFRRALLTSIRARLKDPAQTSLIAHLLRELGLRHRPLSYDLAKQVPRTLWFDPLQVFLLSLDAGVATQRINTKRAVPVEAPALTEQPSCWEPIDGVLNKIALVGQVITDAWGVADDVKKIIFYPIDTIHGMALAWSIDVKALNGSESTHYGPMGHFSDAGKKMRFSIRVVMRDDLPEQLISCGALLGWDIPEKGPLQGIKVEWTRPAEFNDLRKYGTLAYDPKDGNTGADGVATLIFTPNNEKFPGFGSTFGETGVVFGDAFYQTAFGNLPGQIAERLFEIRKWGTIHWRIDRHKPRGYSFSDLTQNFVYKIDKSKEKVVIKDNISGSVCGENPYDPSNWDITEKTETSVGNGDKPISVTKSFKLEFIDDGLITNFPTLFYYLFTEFKILGENPPRMQVKRWGQPIIGVSVPDEILTSVEIQEDWSCPETP